MVGDQARKNLQLPVMQNQGRKNVQTGHIQKIQKENAALGGHIQGLRNKENGNLDYAKHYRWHVLGSYPSRGSTWIPPRPKPYCVFCVEENLVIAYA